MTKKEQLISRLLELLAYYTHSGHVLYRGKYSNHHTRVMLDLTTAKKLMDILEQLSYTQPKALYLELQKCESVASKEYCELFEDIYSNRKEV